ncbi:Crp/Fnr family transcriptional regulator [Candidatus Enterococcus ferrettii]|uniref:Cyclic nucleotide-binding domain-containing protein n=1 Tax=Candidatus Enterococcus ferrettii TaxID=2815324 RepID=A0ABV0EPM9_9ENTE|nr:Crp/Fnr family transcriptional regulator [Enterococcus sp. 665A]MBO1342554.1 Crp/Fnr family transcriptional regulator [Enterococcus sp. 665A]
MARLIRDPRLIDYYKSLVDSNFSSELTMELYEFHGNEQLISEQEEVPGLYYLVAGEVKVYTLLENGEEFLAALNTAPEIFGEIEYFQDCEALFNVEAIGQVYAFFISKSELNRFQNDLQIIKLLTEKLSRKLYLKSNNSIIHLNLTIDGRIANIIYYKMKRERSLCITLDIAQIAAVVNSSYRHVNRVLRKWEKKKIIKREGKHIHIYDKGFFKYYALDKTYQFQ